MAYDHQKVQAWLQDVPRGAPAFLTLRLWMACINPRNFGLEVTRYHDLVDQFHAASPWEQVNMLYGLKDLLIVDLDSSLQVYGRKTRAEDEAADPELQRILRERYEKSKTSTENIPDASMGCSLQALPCLICGEPWTKHICPRLNTMSPMAPEQVNITLTPPLDNCPICSQPYVHHQHPMKPLGVIISSTCGCTGETDNAQEAERRRRGSAGPRR